MKIAFQVKGQNARESAIYFANTQARVFPTIVRVIKITNVVKMAQVQIPIIDRFFNNNKGNITVLVCLERRQNAITKTGRRCTSIIFFPQFD
jgi:hypothetical protein